MRRVYKYPLQLRGGIQLVSMPVGEVIHVFAQPGPPGIALWAIVDPAAYKFTRMFCVFPTGEDIPDHLTYVGTVHIGWTVWHVFEDKSNG